ncbi:unnamed protein product [Cylicostephanus goldi]|uniref:Uncharacterized protein n=1 Tax=Cylicostephanus goldi TaxID=71465 RepID=A0A3P7M8D1_CYLGO|nr:unnamed protein product [Cylicostephanus goldi]
MYVLLNLKDGSRLTDVVQLLFSHGHTAVSVAENIEDLCPTCEHRNNHKTSGAEHNDDQGDVELEKEHHGPPSKRKARIEYLGLETFQCQVN